MQGPITEEEGALCRPRLRRLCVAGRRPPAMGACLLWGAAGEEPDAEPGSATRSQKPAAMATGPRVLPAATHPPLTLLSGLRCCCHSTSVFFFLPLAFYRCFPLQLPRFMGDCMQSLKHYRRFPPRVPKCLCIAVLQPPPFFLCLPVCLSVSRSLTLAHLWR